MTTGSSTAVQATQNSAVSETDVDDTLLTIDVRTIAGQQDISRQAIERGTGIDQFVAQDLIRSWHTTLDNQIINGNGESGTILGLKNAGGNAVTFTERFSNGCPPVSKACRCDSIDSDKFVCESNSLLDAPKKTRIFVSCC
jgi:HK97 family phage major capsid protein